jgi:hypothetical protein
MANETKLLHFSRSLARVLFLGYLPPGLREDVPDKFILTQLSGIVVGLAVSVIVFFYAEPFRAGLLVPSQVAQSPLKFAILVFALWLVCFASIYLWGKILVLLGILTPKEGKGYPFSRPWLKNMNNT